MSQPALPALPDWPGAHAPIVGMLHAPPLPGSPRFHGSMDAVRDAVLADAAALVSGGVSALMLENLGDAPYFPDDAPPHVVSHMTALAQEVRGRHDVPLGINVLRNDALSALAVAHAVGASFIRVNVLVGALVTDQGVIQGRAHELLRYRSMLGAGVKILADVRVKHAAPLAGRALEDEVRDTVERGLADGLVVSGPTTGAPTDLGELKAVKASSGPVPVFVGSGVTAENVRLFLPHADGVIVGTSLKRNGVVTNPVDTSRVRTLCQALAE